MPRWLIPLLAAVLGIAAGVVYGWAIDPVKFVDTTPASLRADYRTDYVLMVAEAYHADHNIDQAGERLAIFGTASPAALAQAAVNAGKQFGYAEADLVLLQDLTRALQASQPPGTPAGGTP